MLQSPPPLAWQQIERYLAASAPPWDPAALYDATAADALLIIGNTLQPRADVTATDYAKQVRGLTAPMLDAERGPRFQLLEPLDWLPDEAGGTLRARVKELLSGTTVTAVFRLDGPALAVFGAYIDDGPIPAAPIVTARVLAELAHWEPHERYVIWPLTGLALSFHRLHDAADKPFEFLPESRFTCQGRGDCCTVANWGVTTHDNARMASGRMPWQTLGVPGPAFTPLPLDEQLPGDKAAVLFAHDDDGKCLALAGQACSVHLILGWQPLSPCLQYPFTFTLTPESICVTASHVCHTVAENEGQPFAERAEDLRQRLQPVRPALSLIRDPLALYPGGPRLTWAAYRVIEMRLLAILDETHRSVEQRLILGNRLMMAVLNITADPAVVIERLQIIQAWPAPLPELPVADGTAADALAATILVSPGPDNPGALLGGGRLAAWQAGQGQSLGPALDTAMLTRYLRTPLFRKTGMIRMGAIYPWAMLNWVYRVWQRETLYRAGQDGVPIDHALQLGTVRRIERLHLHSPHRHLLYEPTDAFGPMAIRPETWASLLVP